MAASELETSTTQGRNKDPELSLNGFLGPWVWVEVPGEDGQGH